MDHNSGRGPEREEESLAYGDYHDPPIGDPEGEQDFDGAGGVGGERGLIGDTYRNFRGKYQQPQNGVPPSNGGSQPKSGLGSFILGKLHDAVQDIGSQIGQNLGGQGPKHSHTHTGAQCDDGMHDNTQHRYGSFAAQRSGNDVKWFVDGCGYFWAVSMALERATQSIWILDCEHLQPRLILLFLRSDPWIRVAVSGVISTKTSFQERALPRRSNATSCCSARCQSQHHRLQGS